MRQFYNYDLNNSIIGIKRLWYLWSFFVVLLSLVCLLFVYLYSKAQGGVELEEYIRRTVAASGEQVVYGNYRNLVEALSSDSKVNKVTLKTGGVILGSFERKTKGEFFELCRTQKVSNGNFDVEVCKSSYRVILIQSLIVILSLLALLLGYIYLIRIELSASGRIKNALSEFGISFSSSEMRFDSLISEMSHAAMLFNKTRDLELRNIISEQVSHDIRSPLSALEMVSSQLSELPEERRLIIRNSINRIRDIANSLRVRKKSQFESDLTQSSDQIVMSDEELVGIEFIFPLLETLVTEKRLEYRDRLGLQIEFNQTSNSYGLFAKINSVVFLRIISNLINNSVESFIKHAGTVKVVLSQDESNVYLSVVDNGKGIPAEIIPTLGTRGKTFGKSGGTGLGLSHAMDHLKRWGGSLDISSKLGKGTSVTISLPKESSPSWFVDKLVITASTQVVILDDDQSVHQIWRERMGSLNILSFSNFDQIRGFYRQNFHLLDEALFLVDYEILGENGSGVDLIEQLGIQSQSILVTSRYEESSIRERCSSLGVPLIPKSMSGFVPIEIL